MRIDINSACTYNANGAYVKCDVHASLNYVYSHNSALNMYVRTYVHDCVCMLVKLDILYSTVCTYVQLCVQKMAVHI